ncbi:MAG: hypothetical protein SFU99_18970 [Saprospiraceae bacterium]|nr:hypothetical protein [Saprospiraceae bacterium]
MKILLYTYVLVTLLISISCNLNEDLKFTKQIDLSELNSKPEYTVFQGSVRLMPSKMGLILFIEGNTEQENKTFLLQTKVSLLNKERVLGQGKIYYQENLLYFDGVEQFSLYLSDVNLPIKLKQAYSGFGLARYNQLIDVNYFENPGDASCRCRENASSGSDCDAGGPGAQDCSVGGGSPPDECNCSVTCSSGYFACCIHCN